MTIVYWDDVEDSVWWQVAKKCDYATFFNTPSWFHLAKELTPGSQIKITGGKLTNGTQFILPIVLEKQMGPFYRLTSSVDGVYGGIIADGPITDSECRHIYQNVIDKWRVMSYTLCTLPFTHFNTGLNKFSLEVDKTYMISLSQGYEKIFNNYSRGHKSALKKAVKAGIVVEPTTNLDDYQAYYQVYLDSLNRWGESFFGLSLPWSFFKEIHELALQRPENIQLWVGRLGNEVISGAIIFYWNKFVNYFHGANLLEYLSYRAANLVQNEIIKHATISDSNYSEYDFGPSGMVEGVLEFKRRFGANELPTQILIYSHPMFKVYNKLHSRLAA